MPEPGNFQVKALQAFLPRRKIRYWSTRAQHEMQQQKMQWHKITFSSSNEVVFHEYNYYNELRVIKIIVPLMRERRKP